MFDNALKLVSRREAAQKYNSKCPFCSEDQIQLKDWTSDPLNLLYKCRICKREFKICDRFESEY